MAEEFRRTLRSLQEALDLERVQVKLGSCTSPGFQVIRLVREVSDRFFLGVILGLKLLSPYFSPFLSFRI